mmetsp:Transcript_9964/g.27859  ORF Transcript_9964/g.27859 Transcript_9964/m.27859 type:complete len:209 (-) Transcript_9964:183-809(-)
MYSNLARLFVWTLFVVSSSKPVFKYTFGSNSPDSLAFGTVLQQLLAADGVADAVQWELHPMIRTVGDPEVDLTHICPSEDDGCPFTASVLCAVTANNPSDIQKVSFLSCFATSSGNATSKGKLCASEQHFAWEAISFCIDNPHNTVLKMSASMWFESTYPEVAHGGNFMVPQVSIDGVVQSSTEYSDLLAALCAKQISAEACAQRITV